MLKALLLTAFLGTGYYQIVHDGNHVHEVYRDQHDKVVGHYVQQVKGGPFEVACDSGVVVSVNTEKQARRVVEACK